MYGHVPTCRFRQVNQTRFMVFILNTDQNFLEIYFNEYVGNHARLFQLRNQLECQITTELRIPQFYLGLENLKSKYP